MSKLPALTSQDVIRMVTKKGYILERVKGSHYLYYNPKSNKRVTIPFHKKDLPKGTLIEILKQVGITREEII